VLEKREHFFGFRHPDTLMAKNELGMILCAQGQDLDRAEHLVAEVLHARTEILGEEHAYTLWSVNDMSKVYCEQQRFVAAIKMLEEIVPIVQRTLGERHVGMAMTLGNLAKAYGCCQNWSEAENALSRLLLNMPTEHPDYISTMLGLVRIRLRTKRLEEAEHECLRMLEILNPEAKTGPGPQIRQIMEHLFDIYDMQGRTDDTRQLREKFRMP
jgi:tetratricopeptide (TPR) repeat protein